MPGLPFLESIQRRIGDAKRKKKLQLAAGWPKTSAEINRWTVIQADDESASFSSNYQIEAGFHFTLHGEYYGGYVRSVPMSHPEAERAAHGSPALTIRYNPAHPVETAVLAEDNAGTLPFAVFSS